MFKGVLFPALLLLLPVSLSSGEVEGDVSAPDLRPRKFTRLPFELADVVGLDQVDLNDEARALLARNGFVVLGPSHGNMPDCYRKGHRLPALVTVDSVLEIFLSDFEDAFGELERKQGERFAKLQTRLWDELLARWERFPAPARPAAARLAGLVAVGCRLAQSDWKLPEKLPEELASPEWRQSLEQDLASVLAGQGTGASVLWKRAVDWSAFKPVGPYAGDESLQRYYRLSQWWGLQGLRAGERQERLCAGLLAWVFRDSERQQEETRTGSSIEDELAALGRIYNPFFGPPDDVRLQDLSYVAEARWPDDFGSEKGDQAIQQLFKEARKPTFLSEWPAKNPDPNDQTGGQGLRLLPPRLTPESLCYGRTVWAERTLPNGLDALACFGDDLARELTLALEAPERRAELSERMEKLRKEMAGSEHNAKRLELQACLRRLYLALAAPRVDERMPLFMQTREYHLRGLSAALACWAGTREIYSVRTRMSYAVGGSAHLPGVAEPNLDAWQRLIELWAAANCAFKHAGVRFRGGSLDYALSFRAIAEKQLRGEALTKVEADEFPLYSVALDRALLKYPGGQEALDRRVCVAFARSFAPNRIRWAGKTCCQMYALVEYGGKLHLCKGGVFDYREFDRRFGSALTRKEFQALMDSKEAPPPPSWTSAYRLEPNEKAGAQGE